MSKEIKMPPTDRVERFKLILQEFQKDNKCQILAFVAYPEMKKQPNGLPELINGKPVNVIQMRMLSFADDNIIMGFAPLYSQYLDSLKKDNNDNKGNS